MKKQRDCAPWRPLLTGDGASRALDVVREIARAVDDQREMSENCSLATGAAGIALLFAYLDGALPNAGHRAAAERHLAHATTYIATHRTGPDLYGGFSGVAWASTHIGGMLNPGAPDRGDAIDDALVAYVDRSPWRGDYDLVGGLVGLGVYALERLPRPAAVSCAEAIVRRLDELAERSADGLKWHTASRLLPQHQREDYPGGYYNLGVAHGMPGIIALLGRLCAADIARDTVRPMLDGAVRWLTSRDWANEDASGFPAWSVGAERDPTRDTPAARLGWCYGDLGLAVTLFVAARCVGEATWEDVALRIARRAAARPREGSGVVDAGLCHGAAGVSHLFNRLYQATGDDVFRRVARDWIERALEMREPGTGIAGYRPYSTSGQPRDDDPGLLTGSAGIGLALLAAATDVEPAWDRMLLLSASSVS